MTRELALEILNKYLTNKNLIKHSLAAEAAMKAIYRKLDIQQDVQKEAKWGIVGLLHDADYELCKGNPEMHGLLLFEKEPDAIPDDITHAIKAHNYDYTNIQPLSKMDWAIACCDQLTGLIVAAALVHPEKKLAPLTIEFVLNRMNEKSFAKGAKREPILLCQQKLGIPLEEFVSLVLTAMKSISNDLEL